MPIDIDELISSVRSGKYSRKELDNLRKNAITRGGKDELVRAIDSELSYGGNSSPDTKEIGFQEILKELKRQGVDSLECIKEGNKQSIVFEAPSGDKFTLFSRSKTAGTWQTTIDYGVQTKEKKNEREFWVFVDLEYSHPKFYVVPQWWIQNNIWEAHSEYLRRHGGKRARSNESKHHAVSLDRIKRWDSRWDLVDLPCNT